MSPGNDDIPVLKKIIIQYLGVDKFKPLCDGLFIHHKGFPALDHDITEMAIECFGNMGYLLVSFFGKGIFKVFKNDGLTVFYDIIKKIIETVRKYVNQPEGCN